MALVVISALIILRVCFAISRGDACLRHRLLSFRVSIHRSRCMLCIHILRIEYRPVYMVELLPSLNS